MVAVHTSREFEGELQEVRQRSLAMAALCEDATTGAFQAFWQGKPELAAKIPEIEAQLDKDEVDIEALVLRTIALRQPVAGDLRFLAAALRLVTDLERIGDAAVSISECMVANGASAKSLVSSELHDLDRDAQEMLRCAIQAFVDLDPEAARHILLQDDAVDRRCAQVIAKMTEYLGSHPDDVPAGLRVIWVAKYLERVADHATNIAEEVIFMVRGEDVRHAPIPSSGNTLGKVPRSNSATLRSVPCLLRGSGAPILLDPQGMIEHVVRYLEDAGVPFRLAVYPMPEPSPPVAYPLRSDLLLVDARVVLVDGSPAIVCATAGVPMNLSGLGTALGVTVLEASTAELRDEFRAAPGPVPPLGGLFGVPLFVDEDIAASPRIVFRAFAAGSYVELAYEDFARIERPRVAPFARAGMLPPSEDVPHART